MHITSDVIVSSIDDVHVVLSLWKVTDLMLVELNGISGLLGNEVIVTKRF